MKVLYFWEPRGGLTLEHKTNPYGPLLAMSLERIGVELEFGQYSFKKEYLEERRAESGVIHINWLHHFYKAADLETSLARYHDFCENLSFAKHLGYRIIWTCHNVYPHERPHPEIDHLARLMMCRIADEVTAHCRYAAGLVEKHFYRTDHLHVVPHGNYIDAYPNEVSREEAREKLGIGTSPFVYLFVGNARPYKGIENLIEAFQSVASGDDCLLMATRQGLMPEYGEKIQTLVQGKDNIRMVSSEFFGVEEFQYFLNAADVVVLPFMGILTSGTAIMALSFGKPVILPRLGCLPELVDDTMGLLYDPKAEKGLDTALMTIRERDLDQAGKNAYKRAEELDWDLIAEQLAGLYKGEDEGRTNT